MKRWRPARFGRKVDERHKAFVAWIVVYHGLPFRCRGSLVVVSSAVR